MLWNKKKTFSCPASGRIIALEEVEDPVFAQKMMGDGFAIVLTDGHIYAPFDGEIVALFPTLHAYGIKSHDGIECLIHIGLDTVNLKTEGFTCHVSLNQKVQKNDLIASVDLEVLKKHQLLLTTPIIFTNEQPFKLLCLHEDVQAKNDNILKL